MNLAAGVIGLAATVATYGMAAQSKHPIAAKHTVAGKAAAPTAGTKAGSKSAGKAKTRVTTRGRTRRRVASGPTYQTHPDPERYQQIQQALADKGYYKGTVNGEWNADSVDALKRFQADNKLDSDGRLTSLTLRGLGLGPKHDGSTAPLSGAGGKPAAVEPPPVPSEVPTGQAEPQAAPQAEPQDGSETDPPQR